ncbi:MAG: hypothetical protein PVH12_09015, partial [Candidatus Bathyarchaeota archaeon]
GILVAGVISVFYAVMATAAVETTVKYVGINSSSITFYIVLFITVFLANVGAYAFTTEIPLHLTRTKNTTVQILAHLFSSTTATFIKTLELESKPVLNLLPIDNVGIAILIILIPFIIIAYTVTRRSKEGKRPR